MWGHAEHPTLVAFVSDWVTALCYYAIPAQLLYFLAYFPYHIPIRYRAAVVLAAAFVCLCGSSHLLMTMIQSGYLSNQAVLDYMKLATAVVSAVTALVLLRLIPEGLRFVNYSLDLEIQMKRKLIELDEAHRVARKANYNKGIFISTVSHELRNPLHAITANVDFLFETSLTSEQKEYVRSVNDSAMLMTSIVNDVLDMSRLQSGRMSFERIPCDLYDICASIIKNLRQQARAKRVTLMFDYEPMAPRYIISDSTRIHQLLLNLLSNALKFTSSHQNVTLSIATVGDMPHGTAPPTSSKEKEAQSRSGKESDELEDITDATLRLLAGTGARQSLLPNASVNTYTTSCDDESDDSFHSLLPCLSDSAQFTSAARSICLDYYHYQTSHIDEVLASEHSNEHKFIHTAEEDQFEDAAETDVESGNDGGQRRRRARDHVIYKLTVHDTGVGISPHALAQLFTAYTQAKLSTVREFGGTGLGLSICAEIIKSMKGCVQVTSELGHGSEFSFVLRLPLSNEHEWQQTHSQVSMLSDASVDNDSPDSGKPVKTSGNNHHESFILQPVSPAVSDSSSGSSTHDEPLSLPAPSVPRVILVVDDNAVNLKILARILTSLHWDVVTASDGLQAVEAFRTTTTPFFCAFIDLSMPVMDGHEATRHIRALGFRTPIVALTANALNEEKQKSFAAGMGPYHRCTLVFRAAATAMTYCEH